MHGFGNASGPCYSVTSNPGYEDLTTLFHALLHRLAPQNFAWCSWQVNVKTVSTRHVDNNVRPKFYVMDTLLATTHVLWQVSQRWVVSFSSMAPHRIGQTT